MHEQGFAPVFNASVPVRVLILGSMPGIRSLEEQAYYAHPQNSFWWIMSELFHFDLSLPYQDRTRLVAERGVVIWDVIHACYREGSLDSSIEPESIEANDFSLFLKADSTIQCIAFNGQTSRKVFKKYVESNQGLSMNGRDLLIMPSTSPAHASVKKEAKLEKWRQILSYL